jgi:hypothetical protein
MKEQIELLRSMDFSSLHRERSRKTKIRHEGKWGIYDSPVYDYEITFSPILGRSRISDLLKYKPSPVVVDLMASSRALRTLFRDLPQRDTFGIALSIGSVRTKKEKSMDKARGIRVVNGNLNRPRTLERARKLLGGRKVDLVMARPVAGLDHLINHPLNYAVIGRKLWSMLDENGAMLLQLPAASVLKNANIDIDSWVELMNTRGIEARWDGSTGGKVTLFVRRNPSSPDVLPFPPGSMLYEGPIQEPKLAVECARNGNNEQIEIPQLPKGSVEVIGI